MIVRILIIDAVAKQKWSKKNKSVKSDVANCTSKDVSDIDVDGFEDVVKNVAYTKDVSNALICCAKDVDDIENNGIEVDGINITFDVQFMKVDVVEKIDKTFVSRYEMFDRRFMIGDKIEVLLLNNSMWGF